MTVTALDAAYKATKNRLTYAGASWGTRVYAEQAPKEADYPYVVYFWHGGGEANERRKDDANLTLMIMCISNQLSEAFAGAAQIAAKLNNKGVQESPTDYVYAGTDWSILTITQEEQVQVLDSFEKLTPIYHSGARYRYVMETI